MEYFRYKNTNLSALLLSKDNYYNTLNIIIKNNIFKIYKLGKTTNNEDIISIISGNGKKKIFIWAGKHGNEHTGIVCIFDFLNYIKENNNNLSEFTFVILPCLNIDGMLKFTRVNYIGIDINRDAIRKESAESKFFISIINEFKPDLCISLHDQRSIYNLKNTKKPAILSFLSASENKEREITDNRRYIMKLISFLNDNLIKTLGNHIGKYNDEFYHNAYGDNLMKLGYKNILIESGIGYNDYYREKTRKYTFFSIIYILEYLKKENNLNIDYTNYFKIPENDNKMIDIIIRNSCIYYLSNKYKADIGISINIKPDNFKNNIEKIYKISHIGDLSLYYSHLEIDAKETEIKDIKSNIITLDSIVNFTINNMNFYDYIN